MIRQLSCIRPVGSISRSKAVQKNEIRAYEIRGEKEGKKKPKKKPFLQGLAIVTLLFVLDSYPAPCGASSV
jgi:hypothetical protein